MGRAAKPTCTQIVREVSVGLAIVERVPYGRDGVRAKTAKKVILAAHRLD